MLPFFASAVLAGMTILEAADGKQRARLLPGVAAGTEILTLAIAERGARLDGDVVACRVEKSASGWSLSGAKTFVPFAGAAHRIVVVARTTGEARDPDGLTLLVVDPASAGVTVTPTATLGRDQQFEVSFASVAVLDHDVLGQPGGARAALSRAQARATVCLSSEMLGGADAVLAMTIEQAHQPRQRGRPVGRHQALQHRIADSSIAIDVARTLIHNAAWRLDQELSAGIEVSMAKAAISDAYRDATWLAALVLGGAGFMDEHPLGRHYRRAKTAEFQLGDADAHRELVARALLA
jgi:alkylation response protein AidB-like acyl-CoA dehydrogenase